MKLRKKPSNIPVKNKSIQYKKNANFSWHFNLMLPQIYDKII